MPTPFLYPFALMAAGGALCAQSSVYVATFDSNANSCTTVTQQRARPLGAPYPKAALSPHLR
jgi:hypothetical protein